jgi:uncharacterized delta-60 repeat protein
MRPSWRLAFVPAAAAALVAGMVSAGTASVTSGMSSANESSRGAMQLSDVRASPGDLDASFGDDGKVTTRFAKPSSAWGEAIQADGKIVVAGETDGKFALARYNHDGSLDASFGGDGKVTTRFAAPSWAWAAATQGSGKIVVAGVTHFPYSRFALARYNPDGTLDTSFGGDGRVTTHFAVRSNDEARALAIRNGKILVAGVTAVGHSMFALARYNTDGTLDTSFGDDGKVTTHFAVLSNDGANAVAIQSNGRILVGGRSIHFFGELDLIPLFALARYTTTGKLDATFGHHGKVTTEFHPGSYDEVRAVAILGNGKILAAGDSYSVDGAFALTRYKPDGKLDASFGGDGKVTTEFAADSDDEAHAMAIQADGRIVAAGSATAWESEVSTFALARYKQDGTLNGAFGENGTVTTEFTLGSSDGANGIGIQADGKIVAAGESSGDFAVARYLSA